MAKIDPLLEITAKLRDPKEGCPWDLAQTFETIAPFTLEEAYEVDHAIRGGDMTELREELGDLLFQVALHAQMAHEAGHFDFDDVVDSICGKLTRRHPHVFGDPNLAGKKRVFSSPEEQSRHWEETKARERAGKASRAARPDDLFEDIPKELPALARAAKLRKRARSLEGDQLESSLPVAEAAGSGLTAPDLAGFEAALDQVSAHFPGGAGSGPESQSIAVRTVGRLLASIVELARSLAVDPEAALRRANHDFEAAVSRGRRESDSGTGGVLTSPKRRS